MRKIAIFGGSFDPITNAHIDIARQIHEYLDCDVVFLPAKLSRWKENTPASKTHRLNMLKLALQDEQNMSICTLEVDKNGNKVNYTIDTALELLDIYKGYKIYYIIGTDQLNNLHRWKDIDELCKIVKFVLINREGHIPNKENIKKYYVTHSNINMSDTSSTAIRNFESVDTKEAVLKYISDKSLYIKQKLKTMLKKDRYEHTVRVADLAKKIAKTNGFDPDKAYKAGLLHDCAKNLSHEKTIELMLEYEPDKIGESHKVYHQFLGPVIAKQVFKVEDQEILHAIKCHTTGNYEMNILDKITYTADAIEPGRGYDSSFYIKKSLEDINIGFLYVLLDNLTHIRKTQKQIFDLKLHNYLYDYATKGLEKYELEKLVKIIDDKYGYDIEVYDISNINPLTKYTIICSANNDRQANAIGDNVIDCLYENQFDFHHKEMSKGSTWTLIDANNFLINIVKASEREQYKFEEIYKDCKKIDIKYLISE